MIKISKPGKLDNIVFWLLITLVTVLFASIVYVAFTFINTIK
jgi:hypothetical protein